MSLYSILLPEGWSQPDSIWTSSRWQYSSSDLLCDKEEMDECLYIDGQKSLDKNPDRRLYRRIKY